LENLMVKFVHPYRATWGWCPAQPRDRTPTSLPSVL